MDVFKHNLSRNEMVTVLLGLIIMLIAGFYGSGLSAGLLVLVLLGLVYLKRNRNVSFPIHSLLQIIGAIGLLGLHGNSVLLVSSLYFLAIILINGDKSDDWRLILGTSPIWAVILLGFFFFLSDELPRALFPALPHLDLSPFVGSLSNLPGDKTVIYLPFVVSVLGFSVFLVWKKTRSLLLSGLLLTPLLVIAFYFLMILSVSGFRPGL